MRGRTARAERCCCCAALLLALLLLPLLSWSVESIHTPGAAEHGSYSALCAVGHDEQPFIREWVKYHLCLGVGEIHLFDHESQPRMESLLTDLIAGGRVTVERFQGHHRRFQTGFSSKLERFRQTAQGYAYTQCLSRYSARHTFIGFLDIDEFLVINEPRINDINDLLKDYEDYGGVSFHWRTLGSSGHTTRPPGSVVDSYTSCLPRAHLVHRQIKSFINTRFHPIMISPHRAEFHLEPVTLDSHDADVSVPEEAYDGGAASTGGPFLVDEAFVPLKPTLGLNRAKWRRAAVYHYVTKSREDFSVKAERGGGAGVSRTQEYFDKLNRQTNATCMGAIRTRRRFCEQQGHGAG